MTAELAGRTILVTGATAGIGGATARLAADRGTQVILTDVYVAAEATAAAIREGGGIAAFKPLDVTDADACAALVVDGGLTAV